MSAASPSSASSSATNAPDAWRVEVFRDPAREDPDGERALREIAELGITSIGRVRLGRGYLLSPHLERAELQRIVDELLVDPVLDRARVSAPGQAPEPRGAETHCVLVIRKSGVMDPVAASVEAALARTGLDPASARSDGSGPVRALSFRAWELTGEPTTAELEELGRRLFANEVIEDLLIDREDLHFALPSASGVRARVEVPLLEADDAELERISREGELSLSLLEMRTIQSHFRGAHREPTVSELETLAQTWSEHCKHKTFAGMIEFTRSGPQGERREMIDNLFRETIRAATVELARPWCVSVFHDNAGIVEFTGGWDVSFKVETHNHPSAIDPYGGAGTGIGGVIRDILGVGLGAQPIANTDAFFVGPLDMPDESLPKGTMHPRRILRGVVAGVRDYGNRMGIPTVNGGVWVDPDYVGNPLVYAGTVGLMPRSAADKSVAPGDKIVVAGGRTGRDGIHGATFSSIELHESSNVVSNAAVQIGDPIQEKRVLDGLLRARDRGLYRAVTDCGAGGLSSAVGEMGAECGARVELDRVPLKYPGLTSAEVWISEAQERMVFAVAPENVDALLEVFAAEDCEATVIGEFTSDGQLVLQDGGAEVAHLPMDFLHEGTPRPVRTAVWKESAREDPGCPPCADVEGTLLALLGMPNIASKEWIVRQYDHEVQGMSVLKPLVGVRSDGPGDAAVLQPLADSHQGIAIGSGANPRYGKLDPWAMASAAIDEALRNVVAVGGNPDRTAILDNFSWGNCERPEQLGALVEAARACYATAVSFRTPFISGKDSLNNEYRVGERTIAIPPTLFVSALAHVDDLAHCVTMDLKEAGNPVYLVGLTHPELGGSHYHAQLGLDDAGGRVPKPDLQRAPQQFQALHSAIAAGCVRAAHDLSEGGLAVAAGEMAFAGGLGLELELDQVPLAPLDPNYDARATRLFSESCTRWLVEVPEERTSDFEGFFAGLDAARVGSVKSEPALVLRSQEAGSAPIARIDLEALRAAHQGGFRG